MSDYIQDFVGSRNQMPMEDNSWIFELINSPERRNWDIIIFVEGPTDELFYSNIVIKKYKNKKIKFFNGESRNIDTFNDKFFDKNDSEKGKEWVFSRCEKLIGLKAYNNYNIKFIVDKDYDELDKASDIVKKHIIMLPCYSFENYFFLKENVENVFRKHFPNSYEISTKAFNVKYKKFIDEILQYCIWKSISVKYRLDREKNPEFIYAKDDLVKKYQLFNNMNLSKERVIPDPRFDKFVNGAISELNNNIQKCSNLVNNKLAIDAIEEK